MVVIWVSGDDARYVGRGDDKGQRAQVRNDAIGSQTCQAPGELCAPEHALQLGQQDLAGA